MIPSLPGSNRLNQPVTSRSFIVSIMPTADSPLSRAWRVVRRWVPDPIKIELQRLRLARRRRRGEPLHSPLSPAPLLRSDRRPMVPTDVVVSSDLNRDYLDFWPLTSRAWARLGLRATLVLVAASDDVPRELANAPNVVVFEPLAGVSTSLQATCVRLLYAALIDTSGAVVMSDIDLVPLNRGFFDEPLAALDERFFVAFRDDVDDPVIAWPIPYNAAAPATWGEVFGVTSMQDLRTRLAELTREVPFEGRGATGWYQDQRILRDALMAWPSRDERLWMLSHSLTGERRLYRYNVTWWRRLLLRAGYYTDLHGLPLDLAQRYARITVSAD